MKSNSPSTNLATQAVAAPHGSLDNAAKVAGSPSPTHLTKNGILTIADAPINKFQKNQSFILQISYNKVFDTSEQKQKKQSEEGNETKQAKPKLIIASKLALSDGVCQIKAMIPENSFKKLVSAISIYLIF